MGYYKDGRYVQTERFNSKAAFDKAKTKEAVNQCLLSVQTGTMTAGQALRQLLTEFPLCRKEKRRAEPRHLLSPLIDYYVAETLGKPKPEPTRHVIYSSEQ